MSFIFFLLSVLMFEMSFSEPQAPSANKEERAFKTQNTTQINSDKSQNPKTDSANKQTKSSQTDNTPTENTAQTEITEDLQTQQVDNETNSSLQNTNKEEDSALQTDSTDKENNNALHTEEISTATTENDKSSQENIEANSKKPILFCNEIRNGRPIYKKLFI